MAIIVNFGVWDVSAATASQSWVVSVTGADLVARVHADFYKVDVPAKLTDSTMLTGREAVDVVNFSGEVKLVVRALDAQGNVLGEATSTVMVANRDLLPPSAPSYITYRAQTPTSVAFQWGTATDDHGVQQYRLYNVLGGIRTRIATVNAPATSTTLTVDTRTLGRVVVTAVDLYGNESVDSPGAVIQQDPTGPGINFGAWDVDRLTAFVTWEVIDQSFVDEIQYTIRTATKVVGPLYGHAFGSAEIGVADYEGDVTVTVTARNVTGESTSAESTVRVTNAPPAAPSLNYSDLAYSGVRIVVTPAVTGAAPATYRVTYSRGTVDFGTSREQVLPVTPGSSETFYARAYTASGVPSELSAPLFVEVPTDPFTPPPPVVNPVAPGVVAALEATLTPEIRDYLLQLFTDTRMREPVYPLVIKMPVGFAEVIDQFMAIAPNFGALVRRERTDEESYLASELIDKTPDAVQKLAIWAERLTYDFVFNLGG